MDKLVRESLKTVLFWGLVFLVGLVIVFFASKLEAQGKRVTCEGLTAEIDGVYWKFPNLWTGAVACYEGERDGGVALVTITTQVTIKGSPTALRHLRLIDE